jgi:alkylhydroperoxidase/carboxymuconolactone decarboxylase family protein YurZ
MMALNLSRTQPWDGAARSAPIAGGSVSTDTPVLDTIVDITTASIEHNSISPRDFMLARLAALIAVDAPPASYLANASAVERAGLTAADIEGVMIAVAPVVGTPRVMSAAGQILRALGFAIAVSDAEMGEQSDL